MEISDGLLTPNTTKSKSKEEAIYIQTFDLTSDSAQKMDTDQTGKFSATLYRGNQYIMALLEMDRNAILAKPLKNLTSDELIKNYQILVKWLQSSGIQPKMHILDNECSDDFKIAIINNGVQYQLVPPYDHR